MLTCVNPEVTFKVNSVRHRGAAVALKWLFATIRNFGETPPPEDKTRQEIRTLDIGLIGDKKQYFNKYANGKKISRAAGGVEIQSKSCVTVKHSAFGANTGKSSLKVHYWKKKVFPEGPHLFRENVI